MNIRELRYDELKRITDSLQDQIKQDPWARRVIERTGNETSKIKAITQ